MYTPKGHEFIWLRPAPLFVCKTWRCLRYDSELKKNSTNNYFCSPAKPEKIHVSSSSTRHESIFFVTWQCGKGNDRRPPLQELFTLHLFCEFARGWAAHAQNPSHRACHLRLDKLFGVNSVIGPFIVGVIRTWEIGEMNLIGEANRAVFQEEHAVFLLKLRAIFKRDNKHNPEVTCTLASWSPTYWAKC